MGFVCFFGQERQVIDCQTSLSLYMVLHCPDIPLYKITFSFVSKWSCVHSSGVTVRWVHLNSQSRKTHCESVYLLKPFLLYVCFMIPFFNTFWHMYRHRESRYKSSYKWFYNCLQWRITTLKPTRNRENIQRHYTHNKKLLMNFTLLTLIGTDLCLFRN